MSAAVNDRPHDLLSSRPHLPLTGEFHPLRREFERLLAAGNVIALTTTMLAFTVFYFWPRAAEVPGVFDLGPPVVIQSPPPIDPSGGEAPTLPHVAVDLDKANFEPVDNDVLKDPGAAPEVAPGGDGTGGEPPSGPIVDIPDTPIVVPDPPAQADDYTYWDEAPVMLSIHPPDYPEMVRDAGIDGTVFVRVLIGVNGKVRDARAVEGIEALREPALESARSAIFKPALAKGHPVEVWVVIPITFELRARH